jgi:ATP-dependent DNA ligase
LGASNSQKKCLPSTVRWLRIHSTPGISLQTGTTLRPISSSWSGVNAFVAQIEFLEWTESNHLRHAQFAGLREDKNPQAVIKKEVG